MNIKNIDNTKWKVYVHIVPKEITGYDHDKYYVGITSKENNIERWGNNGNGYKKHIFYRAIQKYGWDNIRHEIIKENITFEEACITEKEYIKKLQSNDKRFGYNMTKGGEGSLGFKHSEESKKKMSESRKGSNNGNYGRKHTEEEKRRMSEKKKGTQAGGNNPRARRVFQFTLNGKYINNYSCSTDAAKETNGNAKCIGLAARTTISSGGFLWAFKEDVVSSGNAYYMKNNYIPPNEKIMKTVFQFDRSGEHFI